MRSLAFDISYLRGSKLLPLKLLTVSSLFLLVSSCGLLSKRQNLPDKTNANDQAISAQEYQNLQQRYNELAKRYELLQREMGGGVSQQGLNGSDDVNHTRADLAETVDVFAKDHNTQSSFEQTRSTQTQTQTRPRLSSSDLDSDLIEEQIAALRKIEKLVSENRFDQGLTEIKKIENSPVAQVRVRAKFNLGEILFKQGEYDLAMQIYEEIIQEDAFSGVVIKTLGRLIVCSENLKLDKKRDTYYSILHDFFERG